MKKDNSGKSQGNIRREKGKPDNGIKIAVIGAVVTVATTLISALIAPLVLERNKETSGPTIQFSYTAMPFLSATTPTPSNLVYINDLSNGSGDWITGNTSDESRTMSQYVINGEYHWDITHYGSFTSSLYPSDIPVLSNFEVSTDVKISGSDIGENSAFCIQFRSSNNKYYSFCIRPIRSVYVMQEYEYNDGKDVWTSLPGDGNSSSAIHQDGFNKLRIIARDENLIFYINDILVADIIDGRLKSGSIWFSVYGHENILTKFVIDNFQVIQLP